MTDSKTTDVNVDVDSLFDDAPLEYPPHKKYVYGKQKRSRVSPSLEAADHVPDAGSTQTLVSATAGAMTSQQASGLFWKVLAMILSAALVVTIGVLLERDLGGVGQRAIFALLYLWIGLVVTRSLRDAREPSWPSA